jgi:hypothetical protein
VSNLHRKVLDGNNYDSLLPKVKCEMRFVGKGDTSFSVSQMKQCVADYNYQTKAIARLLDAKTLNQTCANVQFFCYWHFDYDADTTDQKLRSPACSWYQRYSGIDCKSYTIIASCILKNLGINHFIRKVAYDLPENYTHVYVIVPTDQTVTRWQDVTNYYMIDGTIDTMHEMDFVEARDEFIKGMNHYVLNGPKQLTGINFQSISFNNISNLIHSLSCLGGTAYTNDLLNANVAKLTDYYNGLVGNLNDAISQANWQEAALIYNEFEGMASVFVNASWDKKWWFDGNACTDRNFENFINVATFFRDTVFGSLYQYIEKYFNKAQTTEVNHYTNAGLEAEGYTFLESPGDFQTYIDVPLIALTPKTNQIAAFEFTQPLLDAANGASFDVNSFLGSLGTVIYDVSQATNPNNTTGTGGTYTTDTTDPNNPQAPTQAGFGVVGFLFLAGAIGYMAFSGKPALTTNSK